MIDYERVIEMFEKAKPQGKSVVSIKGELFEVDYNFNPPKVRKIEMKEIEEQEEEE